MMLGDKLPDGRYEFARDLHHSLGVILRCSFIFCHGLFFRLLFVMRKDSTDSRVIPSGKKFSSCHRLGAQHFRPG